MQIQTFDFKKSFSTLNIFPSYNSDHLSHKKYLYFMQKCNNTIRTITNSVKSGSCKISKLFFQSSNCSHKYPVPISQFKENLSLFKIFRLKCKCRCRTRIHWHGVYIVKSSTCQIRLFLHAPDVAIIHRSLRTFVV